MNQLTAEAAGLDSPAMAGSFWQSLQTCDLTSTCFEGALDVVPTVDLSVLLGEALRKLVIDPNTGRSRTGWEVSDRDFAFASPNRTKNLLAGLSEQFKKLGNQYYTVGKMALDSLSSREALRLLNEALVLYEEGLRLATDLDEDFELKDLKFKCLRFITIAHLQLEDFVSAMKCMKVLREGGSRHPSLNLLATKALVGLGRHGEAENELWVMVAENRAPESMWVSAIETYVEGAGEAGVEAAGELFLGFVERRQISAGSAVRVVRSVLGDGNELSIARANAVESIVSDERVVALFDGEMVEKERQAMHALLWNCANSNYEVHSYWIGIIMYEKSMLYCVYEMEELSFQFLCLAYLRLDMFDKAEECVREVEKFGPSVASTYLKFRICLRKLDYDGAINQIQTVINCSDFTPSCLFVLAREAFAWAASPVIVVCLLKIIEFYKSGGCVSNAEYVVLGALTSVLMEGSGNDSDVLEFLQLAYERPSETGENCFFGEKDWRGEQKCFPATSCNFGETMVGASKHDLSVEFLIMALGFYGGLSNELVDENQIMVFKSLISRCNPKHLLRFCLHALQLPSFNYNAVNLALKECLSALLSSPTPDYKDVSLVIRKLITVTSTHEGEMSDEVHRLYRKAHETMVGLNEGEYPSEEMAWLTTTAFKRYISAHEMGLIDLAQKWMHVSVEIANQY